MSRPDPTRTDPTRTDPTRTDPTHAAPRTELVPVAKLTIDPTVQRAADKTRVDRIAAEYDPDALGAVVVSRREDGTHHVIDGQHRILATIAAGCGDAAVTCLVYEGLSRPDEAAMFRKLNNTRRVLPVDKFRVRVVEGDPTAVALDAILARHGWSAQQSKHNGAFAAVVALESVFHGKRNGPGDNAAICETLIEVITTAWGHNADGMRAEVVAGIGAVLLRYNTRVDLAKLVSGLQQMPSGPLGLVGRAKGLRDFRGGKLSDALAEVVVEMLNKGKRNRLPEWRSAA